MMRDFVATAKIEKQMSKELKNSLCASVHTLTWSEITKQLSTNKSVRRLQLRIVKAVKENRWGKVKYLCRLLTSSFWAKALAIKRVTTNRGSKTPGVDKVVWKSDDDKIKAIFSLKRKGYKPLPLRRIYIQKKDKTKLRPLSIPTLKDRAMQALYLLALEPIAETLGDPNSYGFRKYRSCNDAIEMSFKLLCHKYDAVWIFEADIKGCFDNINHDWLLAHIPMDKAILRKWLKAGYIENYRKFNTKIGTPQGGIISPVLMNMTLDGLERAIRQKFPHWKRSKVQIIRYADDFIIIAPSKELLETIIAPLVNDFLKERGLQLSEEKTRISHISKGFNFLSQNVRKYSNTLLIKPSREAVKSIKEKIKQTIRKNKGHAAQTLITELNPIIRGWANYHKHIVSKRTFWKLSKYIFAKLMKWAKQEHPNKKIAWLWDKYFTKGDQNGRFSTKVLGADGKTRIFQLFSIGLVPIRRFTKVKSQANPYDLDWDNYYENRLKQKAKNALKTHQKCIYLQNGSRATK